MLGNFLRDCIPHNSTLKRQLLQAQRANPPVTARAHDDKTQLDVWAWRLLNRRMMDIRKKTVIAVAVAG
jgi:hypothetical protein